MAGSLFRLDKKCTPMRILRHAIPEIPTSTKSEGNPMTKGDVKRLSVGRGSDVAKARCAAAAAKCSAANAARCAAAAARCAAKAAKCSARAHKCAANVKCAANAKCAAIAKK